MKLEIWEEAFDTKSEEFKEMWSIIAQAFIREEEKGLELHHIVPVTYFAQNDENRPDWASISNWGRLIRDSITHPCNSESNLVYLTHDEHMRVHQLIAKMNNETWNAPKIGGICASWETGKVYTCSRPKWKNKFFIRKEVNGYTLLKGCEVIGPKGFEDSRLERYDLGQECWGGTLTRDVFCTNIDLLVMTVRGSSSGLSSDCWVEAELDSTNNIA